ncbi:MAG: hypothetical protein WC656_00185 [Sulfurimonas sp.]|jgi:hypothetical protein
MQAIREIGTRDMSINFEIPKEFGDRFEMILIPTIELDTENDIMYKDKIMMQYQSENGFSKNVLAAKSEDIWNDI